MTASTTSAASCFAIEALSFVEREVLATLISVARSSIEGCLNSSRNLGDESLMFQMLRKTIVSDIL